MSQIQKGMKVRVPKGTTVRSTQRGTFVLGKSMTVTVDHILPGYTDEKGEIRSSPEVRWAGQGGYWNGADMNDVQAV